MYDVLLGGRRCRSIFPASEAPSSEPAALCCSGREMGQTDGRTPDHYVDSPPQYYASSVNNKHFKHRA